MNYGDRIHLYFAVMEIEAWFLAMYKLFERIDPLLTIEYIQNELGIDFKSIDPEREFFKPSKEVNDIMELIGRGYKKKKDEIEAITNSMQISDFNDAIENNRCECFTEFRTSLEQVATGCLYVE